MTMKPHFYLSPESVWMFIKDCPERPEDDCSITQIVHCSFSQPCHCFTYHDSITVAKCSAVKCADREQVIKLFISKRISFSPDTLYPLPEGIRVEVRDGLAYIVEQKGEGITAEDFEKISKQLGAPRFNELRFIPCQFLADDMVFVSPAMYELLKKIKNQNP